jgi:8-oxo-dGTP pyrophosphatase MutT (NUDIX family)
MQFRGTTAYDGWRLSKHIPMESSLIATVAIAILYRQGKFLMQLRDNIPTIVYPGSWAFFGGHLEPEETPREGVIRELDEEISYRPGEIFWYKSQENNGILRHMFHAPLTVEVGELVLGEGWDLGLISPQEIEMGEAYSAVANQVRPLGDAHRQILLDFMAEFEVWSTS